VLQHLLRIKLKHHALIVIEWLAISLMAHWHVMGGDLVPALYFCPVTTLHMQVVHYTAPVRLVLIYVWTFRLDAIFVWLFFSRARRHGGFIDVTARLEYESLDGFSLLFEYIVIRTGDRLYFRCPVRPFAEAHPI